MICTDVCLVYNKFNKCPAVTKGARLKGEGDKRIIIDTCHTGYRQDLVELRNGPLLSVRIVDGEVFDPSSGVWKIISTRIDFFNGQDITAVTGFMK